MGAREGVGGRAGPGWFSDRTATIFLGGGTINRRRDRNVWEAVRRECRRERQRKKEVLQLSAAAVAQAKVHRAGRSLRRRTGARKVGGGYNMGPKKKSQKKFERKHLSGEIVRRKHAKVAAQRRRAKEMRLAASMKDDEEGEESDEEGSEGEAAAAAPAPGKKRLEDMSIDEFLNVGVVDGGDDSGSDEDGDEDGEGGESESDDDDIPAEESDEEEWPAGEGESDDEDEESEDDDDDDDSDGGATENGDANALAASRNPTGCCARRSRSIRRSSRRSRTRTRSSTSSSRPRIPSFSTLTSPRVRSPRMTRTRTARRQEGQGPFSDAKTLTSATVAKLCERAAGVRPWAPRGTFSARIAPPRTTAMRTGTRRLASSSRVAPPFTRSSLSCSRRPIPSFEAYSASSPRGTPTRRDYSSLISSRGGKGRAPCEVVPGQHPAPAGSAHGRGHVKVFARQAQHVCSFMHTFERLTKKILKAVLALFGSGEPALRVQSILLIRNMAAVLPPPTLEKAAGRVRQFAANAKFINASSIEHVLFMTTCVSEIYGLDQQQSYPLAFTYIRQLASLLRGALTNKSKEAFRAVYCWQYINCLECWVRVLQSHAKDESAPLRPLVYPVAQVRSARRGSSFGEVRALRLLDSRPNALGGDWSLCASRPACWSFSASPS